MVEPFVFKLGSEVMCHGRSVFIKSIQRGASIDSGKPGGIYYGVHPNEEARKAAYIVHESQIWETLAKELPKAPIKLVKS